MIPHKSRGFWCILDISFGIKHVGSQFPSVNSNTTKKAFQQSMSQLGNVLKRIVSTVAKEYHPKTLFWFAILDIKDGFCCMAVNNHQAWNFCYVLPPKHGKEVHINDTVIVVPNCLQMGLCKSPPFFCSALETAHDMIEKLFIEAELDPHQFKEQILENVKTSLENITSNEGDISSLVEVFMDNFIGMTNSQDQKFLEHFTRALLHRVRSIFLPPDVTGHHGEDPISQKKLKKGKGTWTTTKDILSWIFDGKNFTITLPKEKITSMRLLIKKVL